MSVYNQLKEAFQQARKDRNTEVASNLSVMLGELTPAGNDTTLPDDSTVIALIQKYINNLNDMIKGYESRGQDASNFEKEIMLWKSFLPPSLTDVEIDEAITLCIQENNITNMAGMKTILAYFKTHYEGRYFPAEVSPKIKEKLMK